MTIFLYKLFLGFITGSLIGTFSYITNLLTKSGAFAVLFIAIIVCGFGPWLTWALLILFFTSSGCIHFAKKMLKVNNIDTITEKGHTRDAWQVIANSLPAITSLIIFYYTKNQLFLIGYVSAIAGATADTWGSEIGTLSRTAPRSIISFKSIEQGISGGVSVLGSIASFFGSLLISVSFWLLYELYHTSNLSVSMLLLVPLICGVANAFIDSLLGATLQVKYSCPVCGQVTEKRQHHLNQTQRISGISWLTNDWVNFFSGCLTVTLSWFIVFYL